MVHQPSPHALSPLARVVLSTELGEPWTLTIAMLLPFNSVCPISVSVIPAGVTSLEEMPGQLDLLDLSGFPSVAAVDCANRSGLQHSLLLYVFKHHI